MRSRFMPSLTTHSLSVQSSRGVKTVAWGRLPLGRQASRTWRNRGGARCRWCGRYRGNRSRRGCRRWPLRFRACLHDLGGGDTPRIVAVGAVSKGAGRVPERARSTDGTQPVSPVQCRYRCSRLTSLPISSGSSPVSPVSSQVQTFQVYQPPYPGRQLPRQLGIVRQAQDLQAS